MRVVAQSDERIDGAVRIRAHELEELLGGDVVFDRDRSTLALMRQRVGPADPSADPATAAERVEVEGNSERWQGGMMNGHPIEDLPTSLRTQCFRWDAIGWAYGTSSRSL